MPWILPTIILPKFFIISNKHNVIVTLSGSEGEQFTEFQVQARTVEDNAQFGVFIDNGDDQELRSCTAENVSTYDYVYTYNIIYIIYIYA